METTRMIGESELILNARGSVYHLDLLPEEIADTIITVGDPDRDLPDVQADSLVRPLELVDRVWVMPSCARFPDMGSDR